VIVPDEGVPTVNVVEDSASEPSVGGGGGGGGGGGVVSSRPGPELGPIPLKLKPSLMKRPLRCPCRE
jgi:hypothetical protein